MANAPCFPGVGGEGGGGYSDRCIMVSALNFTSNRNTSSRSELLLSRKVTTMTLRVCSEQTENGRVISSPKLFLWSFDA